MDRYEFDREEYEFDAYSDGYTFREPDRKPGKKPVRKHRKKKLKTSTKLGAAVVSAAVIGLIGGTVFYGTNYAGSRTDQSAAAVKTENVSLAAGNEDAGVDTTAALKDVMETPTEKIAGTVADVANACMPSLVTIATVSVQEMQSLFGGSQAYEAKGAGTGVIVGQDDNELLIATNNHVINGATSVSVGFVDESTASAIIKGTDSGNDLAVIAVNLADIPQETLDQISIARIGDSDELVLGEQVVAIGNALGYGQSVTSGYVSAFDRTITLSDGTEVFESSDLIMFDAAINAGNSGGALFNMYGELVGINEAKSSAGSADSASVEAMSYAIPISKAFPILQDLMSLETREKSENAGYLGVTCVDVTEDIAESYNMPVGVCLSEVAENSPAAIAGLMKGDIITGVNDMEISTCKELAEEISYHDVGETIELKFVRANSGGYLENTVSVTLGDSSTISQWSAGSETQETPDTQDGGQYPDLQGNSFFNFGR